MWDPTAEGLIPEPSIKRCNAMGQWLDKYGESIYETSASPYERPAWGRYTEKPGYLYLHIFEWPQDHPVEIPLDAADIESIVLLSDFDEQELYYNDTGGGTTIDLYPTPPDEIASVIKVVKK